MIVKYKNGKKVVQTTSDEFQQNIQKPDTVFPSKPKKVTKTPIKKKPVSKTPVQKPRRKRGCGCGK